MNYELPQLAQSRLDVLEYEVGIHQALYKEEDGHCDEAEHDDGGVHVADALETLEPVLTIPADGVQCTPEAV